MAIAGMQGPAMAMFSYGAVGLCALPLALRQSARWRDQPLLMLLMLLAGGWGAASFVIMLTIGDVVREILLFYLAPAWSVMGARLFLGERVSPRRALALVMALAGAFLVVRAGGPISTRALTLPDWIALSSGIAFAANNLAARAAESIPVTTKFTCSMLGCAALSGLAMLALDQGLPQVTAPVWLGLLGFAALWTFAGTWTTAFGTTHLEAGRAALLLLSELVIAVVSSSLINSRAPTLLEAGGGLLILGAAAVDAFDARAG